MEAMFYILIFIAFIALKYMLDGPPEIYTMKEGWQEFKKEWPTILLLFLMWLILGLGICQLLFFIPSLNENGSREIYAFIAGFFLTLWGYEKYIALKLFKDAFQVLRYKNPASFEIDGMKNLSILKDNSLDEYAPQKNVALGLFLESKGILRTFRGRARDTMASSLKKTYENSRLYECLEKLDRVILQNLEDGIKHKFPRQIYFLRLNLLTEFSSAFKNDRFLIYAENDNIFGDDQKIICEFCKKVLNQFYSNCKDYSAQPVDFAPELFEKFLLDAEQEYNLEEQ
jgi:hypothetical protein